MKRILLSLAALAALASCVKENTLAPAADQLTISAVSADTKTTLDGLNVVWENTDKIAVVVNASEVVKADFDVSTISGSAADFVGTMSWEKKTAVSAYAVYPSTALNAELKVEHSLPEDQTAGVKSGMLLSSAVLDVEQLQKNHATAQFHNALSLLQVVVPAGVKEVTLTASNDGLVGKTAFNLNETTGLLTRASVGTPRTVKLAADAGLEVKTYPVLVYPGNAGNLTVKMTGVDGAEYENTVSGVVFTAGEAREVNLAKVFNIASEELYVVLPAGGTVEVPVVTADHYEYEVSVDADWITYELPTKGFHKETLTFTVAQNLTDAEREADVTISWGEGKTKTFKISQKNVYMGFLNDADGNPIQWEETFGVYGSESDALAGTNAKANYKNVFTIALSDDFSKGMYKVTGMFVYNNAYTGKTGGTYYADYADNVLTVHTSGAPAKTYAFSNEHVALAYDATNMTFSIASPVKFGYDYQNADSMNGGFLGGYTVAVKAEEPEVEEPEVSTDPIAGTWDVVCNFSTNPNGSLSEQTGTMHITKSGDLYTIVEFMGMSVEWALTQNGNVFTYNHPYGLVLTLTYDESANTLTSSGSDFSDYMTFKVNSINATKQGGAVTPEPEPEVPADPIAGTWDVVCNFSTNPNGSLSEQTGTMHITKSGDLYTIVEFMGMSVEWALTQNGNVFTYNHPYGLVLTLTYDESANTLTSSGSDFSDYMTFKVNSINATKQGGAVTPEPEVPARQPNDSWENAAVVVNDGTDQKYGKFFKELKVYADKDNMYIRLTMEKQDAYYDLKAFESNKLDMFLANGEGDPSDENTLMWWGWTTRQTAKYDEEHKGDMSDGVLTKMRFYQNPGSEEGKVYVDYTKDEVDGNYVYNFTYKREWVAPYVSSEGNIYVAYRLWNNWAEYWVIPQTGQPMLEVVLP